MIAITSKSKVSTSITVIQLTPVSEGKNLNRLPLSRHPIVIISLHYGYDDHPLKNSQICSSIHYTAYCKNPQNTFFLEKDILLLPPPQPLPEGRGYRRGTSSPNSSVLLSPHSQLRFFDKLKSPAKQGISLLYPSLKGKYRQISVPTPSSLSSVILALWNAIPCLTIESPRPVPPTSLEWLLFTR